MSTSLIDIPKSKLKLFYLLLIYVTLLCSMVKSTDSFQNIIYGKINNNETSFLKNNEIKSSENDVTKFYSSKYNLQEFLRYLFDSNSNITKQFEILRENKNFLTLLSSETYSLNITEHTINSLIFLIQRAIPVNYIIKNDTSNPLPLAIDTASLSIIIPELSSTYSQNTNMTLTVYEDNLNCKIPSISMAIDGIYFDFDIALKMAVFNSETNIYDEILDTIISVRIKATVYTQDNKLNIFLMKVVVDDLKIKLNSLDLEQDTLQTKFTGFLSLIIDQTRKMMSDIDVLKTLNGFSGLNFSSFEVITNVGSIVATIK